MTYSAIRPHAMAAAFLALMALPGFFRSVFELSLAPGLCCALVFTWALTLPSLRLSFFKVSPLIIFYALVCLSYLVIFSPSAKAFIITMVVSGIIVTAWIQGSAIRFYQSSNVKKIIRILIYFLFIVILVQHTEPSGLFKYAGFPSTTGFDTEPSHFLLGTGGALLFLFVFGSFIDKLLVFLLLSFVMIWIGSLIAALMLVSFGLLQLFAARGKLRNILFLMVGGLVCGFSFFIFASDHIYSRIYDYESNLSSLVYLQGWEQISLAIKGYQIFGVGLANSENVELGSISHNIFQIYGDYKNLEDFGFLAADLIIELGVFGLILVVLMSAKAIISFLFLVDAIKDKSLLGYDYAVLLGHCLICVTFFDLYVRSAGYLSPGLYFFFLGLSMVKQRKIMEAWS